MNSLTINSNAPQPPEDTHPTGPIGLQTRVGGKVTRATHGGAGNEEVWESTNVKVSARDLMPPVTGILSTARTAATGGPAQRVTEHSIVTSSEGAEMTIKTAVALGLIRRDANGNYSDVEGKTLVEAEAPAADDEGLAFPDAVEAETSAFAASVPGQIQEAVIAQVLSGGLDALDPRHAATAGHTPDTFRAGVSATINAFQAQADAVVSQAGAIPSDFYDWARSNASDAMNTAMRNHVYGRNPTVWAALVEKYLRAVPPDAETLAKAGMKVQKDKASGDELVEVHGMRMSARVAARNGWI